MTNEIGKAGWPVSSPEDAGFDQLSLERAVQFAIANESKMDRDIGAALREGHFEEPWPIGQTIGPVKSREGPNGVILRGGRIVTTWGDVDRVDMTFSISKSYLALCAGIAVDDGLIPDINDPVRLLVDDGGFESEQNRDITWAQLLQLTSEWEGTLWDKPDWIDHNRNVIGDGNGAEKGVQRTMRPPGSHWEYNDVRVNRLALALLRVFKQPLPEVLKHRIMDPIGASDTWEWHGYDNSWIDVDGKRMQSVSGGAHWGGGLWINTLDHARVGQLMMNNGTWNGNRILSEDWVKACRNPCGMNNQYGYLWWLNTDAAMFPGASATSFFGLGVGTNLIWVDPALDLVAVVRWIEKDAVSEFMGLVMKALYSD
ncbi:serine hydrolase domain-containing protein [Phaeobacter marinintestinus]|uniref:serine hydrolase domain-containing protein n=1 Tax=Falsiphaeobacter marinintestinus TaxID=1492905 RepID=UPI0011B82DDB|nr:serine hydrolase [Phaeobacter marinintestinus]